MATLTPRQREVLQLVAEGKGTKDIASMLDIAVKTVEFHKFRIMEELDLHSTAELTKYAICEGMVSSVALHQHSPDILVPPSRA